jgi:DNA primase
MATFTQESLSQLRNRIDLIEVIGNHIDLKKSGAAYKALCPFHDEKSPSFMINRGDSHYHCFGCGAHGDAIEFLMRFYSLSFFEAVEQLAQQFGVHLEVIEKSNEPQGPDKRRMKEALCTSAELFHTYLLHSPEGHQALAYLYSRGLTLAFIKKFLVGLAPQDERIFMKAMHEKRFSNEILDGAGLAKDRAGRMRPFFSDRITFPIHDPMGKVIGFSARKYKEETFGGKYVNTSETVLFKKSHILFGLNYCRRRIAKEAQVIVVEGQVDALRLIDAGFDFTVAGQGTAFGESHVRQLIQLGIQKVYLAFDADGAGREAAVKVGDHFQKAGIDTRVVSLGQDEDPDSILNARGPDHFQKLLETSEDYLPFLIRHLSMEIDPKSSAGKARLVQELGKRIRTWESEVMIHESLRKMAQILGVPENTVGIEQINVPNLYIKRSDHVRAIEIDPDQILESDLIRWLCMLPQLIPVAKEQLKPEDLKNEHCRDLYKVLLEIGSGQIDSLALLSRTHNPETQHFFYRIREKKINLDRVDPQFIDTVHRIIQRNRLTAREEINRKIRSGERTEAEVMELLKEFAQHKSDLPTIILPIVQEVTS